MIVPMMTVSDRAMGIAAQPDGSGVMSIELEPVVCWWLDSRAITSNGEPWRTTAVNGRLLVLVPDCPRLLPGGSASLSGRRGHDAKEAAGT